MARVTLSDGFLQGGSEKFRLLLKVDNFSVNCSMYRVDQNFTFSVYLINTTGQSTLHGGPKKLDCFWDLITLQQLGIGRRVMCQKFPHFVLRKKNKTWTSVRLNILCIVCVNIQCIWNLSKHFWELLTYHKPSYQWLIKLSTLKNGPDFFGPTFSDYHIELSFFTKQLVLHILRITFCVNGTSVWSC